MLIIGYELLVKPLLVVVDLVLLTVEVRYLSHMGWGGFEPRGPASLVLWVANPPSISITRTPRFARRYEESEMGWGGFEPPACSV